MDHVMRSPQQEVKEFICQYKKVLDNFLTPLAILDYMPDFSSQVQREIARCADNPVQQVELFLDELEKSAGPGSLRSFLDALYNCRDQQWIYNFISGSTSDKEMKNFIENLESSDAMKKLLRLLKPQLNVIKVEHFIHILTPWLSHGEKDHLLAKCRSVGDHYTLFWFIDFVVRKEPDWIKEFYKYCKDHNYANETESTLANLLLRFFDFDGINRTENSCQDQSASNSGLPSAFTLRKFQPDEVSCLTGEDGKLGGGSYGVVRLAVHPVHGMVAAKCSPMKGGFKQRNKLKKRIKDELENLQAANHEYVVRVHGWTQWENAVAIIMEYLSGGNLMEILEDEDVELAILLRLRMCCEISNGIAFIHNFSANKRLVHGDIKAENILLTEDLHCKISDFGGARLSSYTGRTTSRTGNDMKDNQFTQVYAAPEILLDPTIALAPPCDVFSFSIVLYAILTRRLPITSDQQLNVYMEAIKKGQRPNLSSINDHKANLLLNGEPCEAKAFDILVETMKECWLQDPSSRPDMLEVTRRLRSILSEVNPSKIVALTSVAMATMDLTTPSHGQQNCVPISRFLPPTFDRISDGNETSLTPSSVSPSFSALSLSNDSSSSTKDLKTSSGWFKPHQDSFSLASTQLYAERKAADDKLFLPTIHPVPVDTSLSRLSSDFTSLKEPLASSTSSTVFHHQQPMIFPPFAAEKSLATRTYGYSNLINSNIRKAKELLRRNEKTNALRFIKEVTAINSKLIICDAAEVIENMLTVTEYFNGTSDVLPTVNILRWCADVCDNIEHQEIKVKHLIQCCDIANIAASSAYQVSRRQDIQQYILPLQEEIYSKVTQTSFSDGGRKAEIVTKCLFSIGSCLFWIERYEEAEAMVRTGVMLMESTFGEASKKFSLLGECYRLRAEANQKLGRNSLAANQLKLAIEIFQAAEDIADEKKKHIISASNILLSGLVKVPVAVVSTMKGLGKLFLPGL